MGEHIDTRSLRRKKTNESEDILARKRRVTFKNYLREVEEDLLEDDLEEDESERTNDEDENS